MPRIEEFKLLLKQKLENKLQATVTFFKDGLVYVKFNKIDFAYRFTIYGYFEEYIDNAPIDEIIKWIYIDIKDLFLETYFERKNKNEM